MSNQKVNYNIQLAAGEALTFSDMEMMSMDLTKFKEQIVKAFGLPDSVLTEAMMKKALIKKEVVSPDDVGHDPLDEAAEQLLAIVGKLGLVRLESVNFVVDGSSKALHHHFPPNSVLQMDLATSDDVFNLLAMVYQEGFALLEYNIDQQHSPWSDTRLRITFLDTKPHIIP